jgi:hypothetical protein
MGKPVEPISNNQTIVLGKVGSGINLYVVNFDNSGTPSVDQLDLNANSVIANSSQQLAIASGSGQFEPSEVIISTYTISSDSLSSANGIVSALNEEGSPVSFRAAQIISVNSGGGGLIIIGVIEVQPIAGS